MHTLICIVSVPPTIIGQTQVPENVSVVVKNPVVLTCEASGMPPPAITWLKDGQPINMSSTVRVISGRHPLLSGLLVFAPECLDHLCPPSLVEKLYTKGG